MTAAPARPAQPAPAPPKNRGWLAALALRIHFYAAVLVGPFLLVAALSGALYALTPQLEEVVYADELTASEGLPALPLEQQIESAQTHLGTDALPAAVRPGSDGGTTRVMFADPDLGESETRAVLIDPGTADVTGDLTAYGTSGSLGVHTWVGQLHRNLHLGEVGRLYSELAASWLAVIAVAGVALWVHRVRSTRKLRGSLYPDVRQTGRRRLLSLHSAAGIWLAAGFVFLSATGLTWSAFAGANVTELRTAIGWSTPSIATDLSSGATDAGEHAEHSEAGTGTHTDHGGASAETPGTSATALSTPTPAGFDGALGSARDVGIDAGRIEIKPPAAEGFAWTVTEIDRSWPTQVDAAAVEPGTFAVVDMVAFEDYPLAAKLARWGIDAHMGVLFGVVNQVVLAVVALGLAAMIVWGYALWFRRKPARGAGTDGWAGRVGAAPARGALRRAPAWAIVAVLLATVVIGIFAPLLGISLLGFLLVDTVIGLVRRSRASRRATA